MTTSSSNNSSTSSDYHRSIARGRTSITTSFYDRNLFGHDGVGVREGDEGIDARLDGEDDGPTGLGGQATDGDMTFHELAALQLVSNSEDCSYAPTYLYFVIPAVERVSTYVYCPVGREQIVMRLSQVEYKAIKVSVRTKAPGVHAFAHRAERQPVGNMCVHVAHMSGYLITLDSIQGCVDPVGECR